MRNLFCFETPCKPTDESVNNIYTTAHGTTNMCATRLFHVVMHYTRSINFRFFGRARATVLPLLDIHMYTS